MSRFEEMTIHPKILKALADLGFTEPTPIQDQVIPLLLEAPRDLVGQAQTGTGKTAAFGIPLLQHTEVTRRAPQALVICPTRELCVQVASDLRLLGKYLAVTVLDVYGGANIVPQIRALERGVHIIVATPGRLHDLIRRQKVDIRNVRMLVLDEADEMLNMGFQEDLDAILAHTPDDKHSLMFSATMPREVANIAKKYMREPHRVTIGQANAAADNVRHLYYMVHARDRYLALRRVADFNPGLYGLVFCRTREETREVAEQLIQDGYNADSLHGDLSQAQRDLAMNKFRRRNLHLLVATDVAARGLDVSDLTHVINYNLPDELSVYTHRIGRTGRAGKAGIAITLIHLREQHKIRELERRLRVKFEKRALPTGRQVCEKQLLHFIDKLHQVTVEHEQIAPFLPAIREKLAGLDREELIQHSVALEFNRFLASYQSARDLNVIEQEAPRERGNPRGATGNPRGAGGHPDGDRRFVRFMLNVGKAQGMTPSRLIGMINDATQMRQIRIGRIEMQKARTRFEADGRYAETILSVFQGMQVAGKKVNVEVDTAAGPPPGRSPQGRPPQGRPPRRGQA
ncbi:MAG: DEAD/DEAH box helicase [Pseudomonadota bacterium]